MRRFALMLGFGLAACASAPPGPAMLAVAQEAQKQLPAPRDETGKLADYLGALKKASCEGVARVEPEAIPLAHAGVPLQPLQRRTEIGSLTYVGGFALTSTDKRFGGLSGIDVLDDGNLLAVSDEGALVWIDLEVNGVTPKAARYAPLLGGEGRPLTGKSEGDSEGLAYQDGLALVSFERDHRVLAFNIKECGAAARGVPVSEWMQSAASTGQAFDIAKIKVTENSGLEALAVTPDWFLAAGLETKADGAGPLSVRPIEGEADFSLRIESGAAELVGADVLPGADDKHVRLFTLHRSSNVLVAAPISIAETVLLRELDQSRLPANRISDVRARGLEVWTVASRKRLADFSLLTTIDNYEGIAAKALPDGRVRLYVISDDNFSASQRTLLMVFETK